MVAARNRHRLSKMESLSKIAIELQQTLHRREVFNAFSDEPRLKCPLQSSHPAHRRRTRFRRRRIVGRRLAHYLGTRHNTRSRALGETKSPGAILSSRRLTQGRRVERPELIIRDISPDVLWGAALAAPIGR
jgi:hypothetical protein